MKKPKKKISDILFSLHYYLHDNVPHDVFNKKLEEIAREIEALHRSQIQPILEVYKDFNDMRRHIHAELYKSASWQAIKTVGERTK